MTVIPKFPQLSVAKTSSGGALIGSPFTWTVTVNNASTVAGAFDVDLVDTLPANWSYVADSATISVGGAPASGLANPTIAGRKLTWTDIADLAPGASLNVTYQLRPAMTIRSTPSP